MAASDKIGYLQNLVTLLEKAPNFKSHEIGERTVKFHSITCGASYYQSNRAFYPLRAPPYFGSQSLNPKKRDDKWINRIVSEHNFCESHTTTACNAWKIAYRETLWLSTLQLNIHLRRQFLLKNDFILRSRDLEKISKWNEEVYKKWTVYISELKFQNCIEKTHNCYEVSNICKFIHKCWKKQPFFLYSIMDIAAISTEKNLVCTEWFSEFASLVCSIITEDTMKCKTKDWGSVYLQSVARMKINKVYMRHIASYFGLIFHSIASRRLGKKYGRTHGKLLFAV